MGLRDLIDRSLAAVRLDAGTERIERISVAAFVEDVELGALIQARVRDVTLKVTTVDRAITIEGDWQILAAALANLLQNAFKFTPKGGNVSLRTRATADRVLFEVEDECGGLPPGKPEELFRAFEQRGDDRTGVGLGLSYVRRPLRRTGANYASATRRASVSDSEHFASLVMLTSNALAGLLADYARAVIQENIDAEDTHPF